MTNKEPRDTLFSRSFDSSGTDRISIPRADGEELFFTATIVDNEAPEEMLVRAASAVASCDARIISQDVLGMKGLGVDGKAALERAFGPPTWPVTWIENRGTLPRDGGGSGGGLCGTQIWAKAKTGLERVESEGRIVGTTWTGSGMTWCRLGGLRPADASASRVEQAASLLEGMAGILKSEGMDFDNVARTWFFFDDILAWYGDFNTTRDAFFRSRGVFDGLVPASTGIGGADRSGPALEAGLLAVAPAAGAKVPIPVPSPLQCPAIEYGSSFSRAVEIGLEGEKRLLVSGTASIDPDGNAMHLDDTKAQVARTMDVVHAILESRGAGWRDVVRAIVYFKDGEKIPLFHEWSAAAGIDPLPALFMQNDVCWDELLFEIEVDALFAG